MTPADKGFMWLLGFITVWVLLFAGEPDLSDAINKRTAQDCKLWKIVDEKGEVFWISNRTYKRYFKGVE